MIVSTSNKCDIFCEVCFGEMPEFFFLFQQQIATFCELKKLQKRTFTNGC
jgi:hypothetical protein